MTDNLNKWRPAVAKRWLYLLSGLMWSGVGVMLSRLALGWLLPPAALWQSLVLASAGVLLALGIYRFGFAKFADKNIRRIEGYVRQKVCVFAFQKWSSYPLVVFMMALGITLRRFSPIPKPMLAVMYIGIGGSLFLASFKYYLAMWRHGSA